MPKNAIFFNIPAEFRNWLDKHHHHKDVLWVGYYKVSTGKASMRWEESVREALCYGWIDGLRKSIDDESYKNRFTPRRPDSHWSTKNIKMAKELIEEGRMQPAGMKAYEQRDKDRSGKASYEQDSIELKKEYKEKIKANQKAWAFFKKLAPGYTKTSIHWVMSAKRKDTRQRRLKVLIESCEEGKKIPMLRR